MAPRAHKQAARTAQNSIGRIARQVLKASTTIGGQRITYPRAEKPEIESVLVEMVPGGQSGRHRHPVPTYGYVIEGTLTVEMDDGSRHTYQAGQGFLEGTNRWHNARNLGSTPMKLLTVYLGVKGKPNFLRPGKKSGQPNP